MPSVPLNIPEPGSLIKGAFKRISLGVFHAILRFLLLSIGAFIALSGVNDTFLPPEEKEAVTEELRNILKVSPKSHGQGFSTRELHYLQKLGITHWQLAGVYLIASFFFFLIVCNSVEKVYRAYFKKKRHSRGPVRLSAWPEPKEKLHLVIGETYHPS